MKVKLLNDGGYDGLESAIGKVFDAIPDQQCEYVLCCEILGRDLNQYVTDPLETKFNNHHYYFFLPEEFEVIEE